MTTSQAEAPAVLAARLSDPKTVEALTSLLDRLDLLAVLVEGLDQFVSRSEVIGDSLLAGVAELREGSAQAGVDLPAVAAAGSQLAAALPKAAPKMIEAIDSGALDKLLATGMVSAEALPQVELLARAMVKGSERFERDPIEIGGPVSLVKLLRDPDVNRAMSFFATVAKTVGQELAVHPVSTSHSSSSTGR